MKNNPVALILAAAFVVSSTVACNSLKSTTEPSPLPGGARPIESFVLGGTVMSRTESGNELAIGVPVTISNGNVTHEVTTDAVGTFECRGLGEGQWLVKITRSDQRELKETVALSSDIYPSFVVEAADLTVVFSVVKSGKAVPRERQAARSQR